MKKILFLMVAAALAIVGCSKKQKSISDMTPMEKEVYVDKISFEYKVSKESMVTYKGKKYSVPTYLIGKQVTISEMDSRINIYYNITDFVCQHEMSNKYLNYHESDLKEIMKSEAYRNKTDEEIQEIIELKKKDILLGVKIDE